MPPGPPPRGYRYPQDTGSGVAGPYGAPPSPAPQPRPGRRPSAATTVFVGIVALLLGLIIGFQLGGGGDGDQSASSTGGSLELPPADDTDAPTVTTAPATTAPPDTGGGPATEPLGTRDNPVPVGQGWILGIWQLEVITADLDATDTVVGASDRNPDPAEGDRYVLVEVELTLADDLFVFADDFRPGIESADGTVIEPAFEPCGPDVPSDFYDQGRLSVEDPVRGNLCFAVPADLGDDLLLTTDGVGDTTTYFALS